MPRHPRIALTSRLRVHTTNDITGCVPEERHQLGRAVRVSFCQVRMIIISARLYCMMMSISGASNRSFRSPCTKSALRTAEAILVSKIEHLTASILKNPFTMSNTGRLDPITVLSHSEPFLFISRLCKIAFAQTSQNDGGAYRDRTDDLMLAKQPLSQLS
ncbi:hypothetical protein SPHINGOT1_260333 [Sphingomonas sp. T1]|nr:hypothetical protein SPHINGOT1_260333 [Sphingomonas sp. T1]